MADVQGISPGYKADPNAPGMQEAIQWLMQQQGGKVPPMQGMPPGITPQQLQQLMMIQQLRQQGQGQPGMDPSQQGQSGGMPPQQAMPYGR